MQSGLDDAARAAIIQECVAALNKGALKELKSLGKPPAGVSDVTDAILALKGEPKERRTWSADQQMMKDVDMKKPITPAMLSDTNNEFVKMIVYIYSM